MDDKKDKLILFIMGNIYDVLNNTNNPILKYTYLENIENLLGGSEKLKDYYLKKNAITVEHKLFVLGERMFFILSDDVKKIFENDYFANILNSSTRDVSYEEYKKFVSTELLDLLKKEDGKKIKNKSRKNKSKKSKKRKSHKKN